MDFDHIPELGEKSFNIGNNYCKRSPAQLAAEIAKCEVVCANCHRERTYQRKAKSRPMAATIR